MSNFFISLLIIVQEGVPKAQYFEFSREAGEILMSVQVWGYVKVPGIYQVPLKTDIVTLISLAGGPADGANISKVEIIRENEVFHFDIEKLLKKGKKSELPLLEGGDIIRIPPNFSVRFSKILSFLRDVLWVTSQAILIYSFYQTLK